MHQLHRLCINLILALCMTPQASIAQEVTLTYKQLTLNADFRLASGKTIQDGIILVTHGSLAHRDMESISYIRKLLYERGYNTLAINLSLGIDNRHGMFDCTWTHTHRNDDAIEEIEHWIGWLRQQGARDIILLGHSRGGAQTALHAVEHPSPLIRAIVLLAPATKENTDMVNYVQRYRQPLPPLLEKAQRFLKQDKGQTVLPNVGLLTCPDTPVTAESFYSYYAQSQRLDTIYLLSKFKVPALVVVAGDDNTVPELDKKIASLVDGRRLQMYVVPGADHLFRDLFADDAVEAIDAFLQSIES